MVSYDRYLSEVVGRQKSTNQYCFELIQTVIQYD